MRLGVHETNGIERTALIIGETVLDLQRSMDRFVVGTMPDLSDPAKLVTNTLMYLPLLGRAVEQVEEALVKSEAEEVATISIDPTALRAPIQRPSKILCVGLNYRDHVEEIGVVTPDRPHVFSKIPTAVTGPYEDIVYPTGITDQIDYEAELAFVVGREARNVEEIDALTYVLGYLVVNDVSARDWQFADDDQLTLGKGFDTFLPMGPWLVTTDEVPDPQQLRIGCHVNGSPRQSASTSEMVFGVAEILSFLSKICTLKPGDLVATGTPAGVGVGRHPPQFLQHGDEVVCEIESIGAIRNRVSAMKTSDKEETHEGYR